MEMAEAKFEEAATWVCWDIENCPIPNGCKAEEISQKISSALSKLNYRGPISIFAYGNMNHIPPSVKKALSSTGVVLNHVHVNSRSSSLHIFDKLLDWAYNPDTSNLMFISRDGSFSSYLSEWQMDRNKNVLLAHPPNASDSFVASANTTWLWNSLCKNLI
ncbi:hypothetical protein F2Q69_00009562 [Brassica cretica]|uniref:NYN domain-containing protein n=1 Tax=Brassica cretica TaxID=69181 RepID=A0A8S9PQZ4_BRACR|nr:hypothetical protein F2Q69_00009562 [Brassica cretica]